MFFHVTLECDIIKNNVLWEISDSLLTTFTELSKAQFDEYNHSTNHV